MRMGVLDVGSNTLHLLLVDAHRGGHPMPAYTHKTELRLTELLDGNEKIAAEGIRAITRFCREAVDIAEDKGAESMLAFATSALREARNSEAVLEEIRQATGLGVEVLSGEDEARLTFLAVRRWYGWSSGRLLCFDIGGGSLEIAGGVDEEPDVAISLPLGAGRLTRSWFTADPPPEDELRKMRKHVRAAVASVVGNVTRFGPADRVVATSKTFRSLARVAGAAPSSDGPFVPRTLGRRAVAKLVDKLAGLTSDERAKLHGVSAGRATQLLAGAVVADAAVDLFDVESLHICPWALREGIILRRLDQLAGV